MLNESVKVIIKLLAIVGVALIADSALAALDPGNAVTKDIIKKVGTEIDGIVKMASYATAAVAGTVCGIAVLVKQNLQVAGVSGGAALLAIAAPSMFTASALI